MAGEIEKSNGDVHPALEREAWLMARAERRLIEHELTRRRTLLALTVLLSLLAVILAAIGTPYLGGTLIGGAVAAGAATIPKRSDHK